MTTTSLASNDLFGEAVYFSPDTTDPEPHAGFCCVCGAPAPLRRVYGSVNQRLCWNSEACEQRIQEQNSAHLDNEFAHHFGGGSAV